MKRGAKLTFEIISIFLILGFAFANSEEEEPKEENTFTGLTDYFHKVLNRHAGHKQEKVYETDKVGTPPYRDFPSRSVRQRLEAQSKELDEDENEDTNLQAPLVI